MKYDEPENGEWVYPVKRGYKMVCCDCGLVHRMDFDHVSCGRGRQVIFRVFRDNRATAAIRRNMNSATQRIALMDNVRRAVHGTCPPACCELTPVELVDAVYELVFAYKPESSAQEQWKRRWLLNAKRYGAGFDC